MALVSFSILFWTALILGLPILATSRWWRKRVLENSDHAKVLDGLPQIDPLCQTLLSRLGHVTVILPKSVAFEDSKTHYWAQQECEVSPSCAVRPKTIEQLCTAVNTLSSEHCDRLGKTGEGIAPKAVFAVRSGGHSPNPNAASIAGGVLLDLRHFCDITISDDRKSVTIGTGAKWADISRILDEKSLAIVGGRNSNVGVGGLILGGGLSFFSTRFGFVCSNVISYEIVLASGSQITASRSTNSDLWRALKGGANNFGIVTRFTVPCFQSSKIWSGFLYMPSFQASKVLSAFHDSVNTVPYDPLVSGPIACFSYIAPIRLEIISVNLVHTAPTSETTNGSGWPSIWQNTPFSSLFRLWSSCKLRTLTDATEEMAMLNPSGRRQHFVTTTVKNDHATLIVVHEAYKEAFAPIRQQKVKGLVWTLVLQPLLPEWARKGDPNPLGFSLPAAENQSDNKSHKKPLVIVSFTINWHKATDDTFIKSLARQTIEKMEAAASARGQGHPYRYLNYCAEWQEPFAGYGDENWRFLRDVSRRYDPKGLFQTGCTGGFKLCWERWEGEG